MKVKAKHSKVREMEMQGYLQPNQKPRMLDVKVNFENKYRDKSCPNCEPHLLECVKLIDGTAIANYIPDYCDLFGDSLGKMLGTYQDYENF